MYNIIKKTANLIFDNKKIMKIDCINNVEQTIDRDRKIINTKNNKETLTIHCSNNMADFLDQSLGNHSTEPAKFSIQVPILVPKRKHKKNRINKKWLKRYGYKKSYIEYNDWQLTNVTNDTMEFLRT